MVSTGIRTSVDSTGTRVVVFSISIRYDTGFDMDYPELSEGERRSIEELLWRNVTLARQRLNHRMQELENFHLLNSIREQENARLVRYILAGLEATRVELNEALLEFSAFIGEGVVPVGSIFRAPRSNSNNKDQLHQAADVRPCTVNIKD